MYCAEYCLLMSNQVHASRRRPRGTTTWARCHTNCSTSGCAPVPNLAACAVQEAAQNDDVGEAPYKVLNFRLHACA